MVIAFREIFHRKSPLYILLFVVWTILYVCGLRYYAGSKIVFSIFSLIYLFLIYSGIHRVVSFGYLFLCIFLWLGFWFKLCFNFLWLGVFPYGEPIGNFDGSPKAWDEVLIVAIVLAVGILIARILFKIFRINTYKSISWAIAPSWYPSFRWQIWTASVFFMVGIATLNVFLGIHQIGLTPRTILAWPGNALVSWFLNIGASLVIAVLVCWDISIKKNAKTLILPVFVEGFISTVSIISRGAFPLHVIPQLIAINTKKDIKEKFSLGYLILISVIFLLFFFIAIGSVSYMRDYYYRHSNSSPIVVLPNRVLNDSISVDEKKLVIESKGHQEVSSFRWILIHQLLVNRWIGLEGVMAISSYTQKSNALLKEMFLEKRDNKRISKYQIISNSGYQGMNPNYQFGSMPGIAGFLYYSGSLWVVCIFSFAIGIWVLFSEEIMLRMTRNPIFCSIYGVTLANTIAQFGLAPLSDLPMYIMIFAFSVAIYLIQLSSNGFSLRSASAS